LTPVVTDPNGGTNTGSPVPVTVNTTPPTLDNPAPGSTLASATPTIGGTGTKPGDTVTVTDKDGTPVCTAKVGSDGKWSCTPAAPLKDGDHALSAVETDANGNTGTPSAPVDASVNSAPPTLDNPTPGSTVSTTTPVIGGTGNTPGDTVTVSDGTGNPPVCTAKVGADGKWSCTPAAPGLGKGDHSLTAAETDQSGNTGVPSQPVKVSVNDASPTVEVPPAGSTVVTDTPTIAGTGNTPGDTVTVSDGNGNPVCQTTVGQDGKWSCTPSTPLPAGDSQLSAAETDSNGNTGAPSAPVHVVVNTTPPSITGPKDGDLTNDATPTITGTGTAAGDTITVKDSNGDTVCTTTVGTDLSWTCTPAAPGLKDGDHSLTAAETDLGGNTGAPSAPVKVSIDTSTPTTPTVDPTNGSLVTGTADKGDTVTVTNGTDGKGTPVAGCENVVADSTGHFKCVPTTPVTAGNAITVVATNAAGTPSAPVTVTVAALRIKIQYPSRTVGQPQTVTCFAYNPGEQVDLTLASTPTDMGHVTADNTGTAVFNITIPQTLAVGQHTATCTGPQSGSISDTFQVVGPTIVTGGTVVSANTTGLTAGAGIAGLTGLWVAIAALKRREEDAK